MSKVIKESFRSPDGKSITRYSIRGHGDLDISVLDYGLTIEELRYKGINRVLTLKTPIEYLGNSHYVGATIGRVAGRISKGLFEIDGEVYPLDKNEKEHCLHGGYRGLSTKTWKYIGSRDKEALNGDKEIEMEFNMESRDGESGFPGNLFLRAFIRVTKIGKLTLEYCGNTDRKTPVTITNHSYFNLNEDPNKTIENHDLQINSKEYLQLDDRKMPQVFRDVKNSPFDFQKTKYLSEGLEAIEKQGLDGIDHPFIFRSTKRSMKLTCKESGTQLWVTTTEPCVVVYSGNQLDSGLKLRDGGVAKRYHGICLETQWFPNAINTEFLPDNFLNPDDQYRSKTEYLFQSI